MWLKSFKSPLVHHLKICKFLRCTIFEWDPASEQLVVAKRKYYIHFRKFLLFTHVLYVVAISLKLILGKDPIAAKCQGIVFLVMLFGCLATRWNFSVISDPCQSMNYFITWEKSIRKNGAMIPVSIPEKITTLFLNTFEVSLLLLHVLIVVIQLNYPCAVPFFGSLSPYCQNGVWTAPCWPVRVFMLAGEVWLWLQIGYDGTFYAFYVFYAAVVCMLGYVRIVER
ncbi:hypothetical protein Fcan01_16461 [Folsomia candida]|uniref:Uncharacterized protein n=1 Tax=Folsomia candida TaxID=158441 RepID=A0A226DUI5_FOLCA|nr:hypothetical protein Fcan01_16461 [Folsomia candida]